MLLWKNYLIWGQKHQPRFTRFLRCIRILQPIMLFASGPFLWLWEKEGVEIENQISCSAKLKTKTEPSRGFFRKGGQYDELKDAASEGTPSPTRSTASDSSRLDIPCLDRDSCSTQQTHKSSGLGTRKSNGFADSILSRFGKEGDSFLQQEPTDLNNLDFNWFEPQRNSEIKLKLHKVR